MMECKIVNIGKYIIMSYYIQNRFEHKEWVSFISSQILLTMYALYILLKTNKSHSLNAWMERHGWRDILKCGMNRIECVWCTYFFISPTLQLSHCSLESHRTPMLWPFCLWSSRSLNKPSLHLFYDQQECYPVKVAHCTPLPLLKFQATFIHRNIILPDIIQFVAYHTIVQDLMPLLQVSMAMQEHPLPSIYKSCRLN